MMEGSRLKGYGVESTSKKMMMKRRKVKIMERSDRHAIFGFHTLMEKLNEAPNN
jgi:hypothetical protein